MKGDRRADKRQHRHAHRYETTGTIPVSVRRRGFMHGAGALLTTALLPQQLLARNDSLTNNRSETDVATPPDRGSTLALTLGRLPEPAHIRRVFAAGPPAAVLLACLAPDKLQGWPMRISESAKAWLSPELAALPHLGRLTSGGRGSTMPLEKLVALAPDLVLDAGTVDATYRSGMERISRQTGLPCVLMQGALADHGRQLREAGKLLGVSTRARELAEHADAVAALAREVQASVRASGRPRVYYGRGTGGMETGLGGSINVEAIDYAGGTNVATAAGRGGLTRVSMEQILAWNPQVILTQDADFARHVRKAPEWRSISAVREGRVHCAPSLPFGWLDGPPGINRLIGLRWLVEKLYPDHPALRGQPPLAEAAADFYALFYGSRQRAADIRALLHQ